MATIRSTRPTPLMAATPNRRRPAAASRAEARRPARSRTTTQAAVIVQDRAFPVFLLIALLHVALAVRLAYLQIGRHGELTKQAEKLREKDMPLPARRGVLLDRDGNLLVQNEPAYNIEIDPNQWYAKTSPGDTPEMRKQHAIEGLSRILTNVDVPAIIAKRGITQAKSGRYRTIKIALNVSEGVGECIRKEKLSGVAVNPTARRTAVFGDLAPHVIGFTGTGGKGLDGLEHGLEKGLTYSLIGNDGMIAAEFDTRGRLIPGTIRDHRPAQHGANFLLTIDQALQHTVQDALERAYKLSKAESATAVVLDPKTGDILALANYPAFDVNNWRGASPEARMNRAVTAPYEPGSTLKTFTIAAAIEDHKITPHNTYYCEAFKKIGRRTIHCHDNKKHGEQDVTAVLANSCNVATSDIGFALGKVRLYHYLRAFGFGEKPHSGLPGEDAGLLKPPDTWADIKLANVAFGQGISVTPLQLAAAYGAIANDGVYLPPRIVRGIQDDIGQVTLLHPDKGRRVVSTETARIMKDMLHSVIEVGTGKPARLNGYTAGGKTATAQLVERGTHGYGGRYVSSFAGMAPANNPQFVILVAVNKPKGEYYGGLVAGPVFKEIAEKGLLSRRIPRDGVMRTKGTTVAPPIQVVSNGD